MERKDENKIYSMPLLKNIGMQVVGKKGWKLTQCPVCGHKCFETPQGIFRNVYRVHAEEKIWQ